MQSWTEDPRTQHFSGTGHYELDFEIPSEYVSADLEAVLDLGKVGDVAEVTLNGHAVGVAWMQPYKLQVTEAIRSGTNHLELLVTNVLINYVSGMTTLPEVPEELVPHYGPTANISPEGSVVLGAIREGISPSAAVRTDRAGQDHPPPQGDPGALGQEEVIQFSRHAGSSEVRRVCHRKAGPNKLIFPPKRPFWCGPLK